MEPCSAKVGHLQAQDRVWLPQCEWITGELHTFVTDTLSPDKLVDQGIFDHKAVEELVHRNRSGKIDASHSILSLVCIQQWFEKFGMER